MRVFSLQLLEGFKSPSPPILHFEMSRQTLSKLVRQHGAPSRVELPPSFLAPALHFPLIPSFQTSRFSTSPAVAARDKSKQRGVSAIHRTGPRRPLLVSKRPLPRPVGNPEKRAATPDHGLWGFFSDDKATLMRPDVEFSHGMLDTLGNPCHKVENWLTSMRCRPLMDYRRATTEILG